MYSISKPVRTYEATDRDLAMDKAIDSHAFKVDDEGKAELLRITLEAVWMDGWYRGVHDARVKHGL
jgi:hypothetical protein